MLPFFNITVAVAAESDSGPQDMLISFSEQVLLIEVLIEGGWGWVTSHIKLYGLGQELTNGLKGVGHVFSFMLKQKKSPHPPT